MARSTASNKRENEKKKQAKKLEKQKKKEERKASGTENYEDMIAYVDENGVITSTPPEPKKKEKVNLEDILISVPRRTEENETIIHKGRVEYFNDSKGYGFIKDLEGKEKYFFHISNASKDIAENNIVSFELKRGPRGMETINIQIEK